MLRCFNADRTLKPLVAACLMAAVVALSLLWTQQGIHVSGVFALLCPPDAAGHAPQATASTCSIHSQAANRGWIAWMVAGIFLGALLTSTWRNHGLRLAVERGVGVSPATRLVLAGGGGLVVGVGAALAGGCTSSIGLSAGALLSVAAFAFLAAFFVGGFAARVVFGRFWHV
jgi:hypothetical protein